MTSRMGEMTGSVTYGSVRLGPNGKAIKTIHGTKPSKFEGEFMLEKRVAVLEKKIDVQSTENEDLRREIDKLRRKLYEVMSVNEKMLRSGGPTTGSMARYRHFQGGQEL